MFTPILPSRQFLRLRSYILSSGLLVIIFYAVLISACYMFRSFHPPRYDYYHSTT